MNALPVLAVKNTVLYPQLVLPLVVGRPKSIAAVEAAAASEDKQLIIVTQRDSAQDEPTPADLYPIGTKAVVKNIARVDGHLRVLVQGIERVAIGPPLETEPYLKADASLLPLPDEGGLEHEALERAVRELGRRALELLHPQAADEMGQFLKQVEDSLHLSFLLGSLLSLDVEKQVAVLSVATRLEALRLIHDYLAREIQILELRHKIADAAHSEISREQREYVLRHQLKAIQEELGEEGDGAGESETSQLRERLDAAGLPDEARKEVDRELKRLARLPLAAPDHQVVRTYLELIAELPWRTATEDRLDLTHARQVLDDDHCGLAEIKDRILEHLAVRKLNPSSPAPLLCFVGPPGVGKTSLGQSIAKALGRKFERLSLGGLHDEAELRGHRRTYIGAMPGRIVQALRRAGAKNPVLLLDEVDKLGQNFRGDPAAALLEILDPAQNSTFRDNYVDLPFDLSQVMFITTANSLDSIPRPLLDRLEIIRLSGYSVDEKLDIAERHLLPRQRAAAGLKDELLEVTSPAVRAIAARYTREAGVRQLDRQFARLCRKVARRHADGQADAVRIDVDSLADWLGPEKFAPEKARADLPPGVATGLAWTEAGGDVLYVEAARLPGGRRLTLTGQLGDVMRESARTAHSWVWSRATDLGIPPRRFTDGGVHLHVPAGAIPKDGPSAGIALATALVSLLTNRPVRQDTAFTGELTLTGLVLPVGGIKEKVLAAHRAGLKRVILSKANESDLAELPESVRAEMEILLVEHVDEVLDAAIPGLRNPGVRRSACRAESRKRRAASPGRSRSARSQK